MEPIETSEVIAEAEMVMTARVRWTCLSDCQHWSAYPV